MNLYLVRHGQTDWNRDGRVQGRADQPVNALGGAQSRAVGSYLSGRPLAAVYCSPALRARQTAEPIAAHHELEVQPSAGLLELDMGALDGASLREMRDRFPDFFRLWSADAATARFPGGETLAELQARAWAAITTITKEHGPGDTLVVVSHAFALYSILCMSLGMPLNHYGRLRQDPGAVSLLVSRRGPVDGEGLNWTLAFLNQTHHLDGLTASQP